ncbi:MAG: glycosyltransferase family 1 protein [Oscillatoriales cyanobacterium]|uniref:glycosyltransferase n=1 Tax=Microcoleus anatoxicus TaxID=2705319 RepID=UPI00297A0D9A|nr:MAG: glycosyltransferase family 1 protein [Oscillatoriales cyanobacterium]TAD95838.1 MAG: glycosyltransferase family 1 protein [Oscillatoriales cyanobacterium]TAE03475.1 MAG: glycosyltransferase family 1 protein [Oscillatoriales cyanobacterium]
MKKLLMVTTIPGTLRAFFLPLVSHLRDRGWQVDGMANEISSNLECVEAFDRVWDVEWSRNPLDPRNLIAAPQQIKAVMNQREYDLVNVSTPVAAFVARYALNSWRKQGNLKIIYTAQGFHFYRGGSLLKNAGFLALEKLAGYWTDYLIVVNREDEEAAKHYQLVPSKEVRYIPGTGLNVDRYNPNAISETEVAQVRQELGLQLDAPMFLAVAEFIPRKHHQDLLKALAQLQRPEVHLALAGGGKLVDQMKKLASELKIQNQVHFLGFRRDIQILMRASVATILVSEQEGLPNCVMESLSLEVPVIGTNIRGTRDLLEKDCGLLVDVGDTKGIANAMAWVLDHPQEAQVMGKKGRTWMANYELRQIVKLHEELYVEATA